MKIKFNSSPGIVRDIYELIDKTLSYEKIDENAHRRFMLAVGEAIDNAIIHGNKFSPEKFVEIEYIYEPSKITFVVIDEGDGFDYNKHMGIPLSEFEAPKLIEKTFKYGSPGGLGLVLMRKSINEIVFAPPGNKITIIKYLTESTSPCQEHMELVS